MVPSCLEGSPTALWWNDYYAAGGLQGDLVEHIEDASDYDGLAVVWGRSSGGPQGGMGWGGIPAAPHI